MPGAAYMCNAPFNLIGVLLSVIIKIAIFIVTMAIMICLVYAFACNDGDGDTTYKTSDGKTFSSKSRAQSHQDYLNS